MLLIVNTLVYAEQDRWFYEGVLHRANKRGIDVAVLGEPLPIIGISAIPLRWELNRNTDLRYSGYSIVATRSSGSLSADRLSVHARRLSGLGKQEESQGAELKSVSNYARFAEGLFDQLQVSGILACNPLIPHTGIPYEIATHRGIPAVTFERGFLPGSFVVDKHGYGGWSELCHGNASFGDWFTDENLSAGRPVKQFYADREATRSNTKRSTDKFEVDWESLDNARLPRVLCVGMADCNTAMNPSDHTDRLVNSPGFNSSAELAQLVAGAHEGTTIFAPHPHMADPEMLRSLSGEKAHIVVGELAKCLQWADVVVCNGSSVEFSALLKDKPVVLCGRTILTGRGICYEALSPANLRDAITQAAYLADMHDKLSRFTALLGYLMRNYLVTREQQEWPLVAEKNISAVLRSQQTSSAVSRRFKAAGRLESVRKSIVRAMRGVRNMS